MTAKQRRKNVQNILDRAKVIMAHDREKLLAEGKVEESFALLARQQECEQMVLRKMNVDEQSDQPEQRPLTKEMEDQLMDGIEAQPAQSYACPSAPRRGSHRKTRRIGGHEKLWRAHLRGSGVTLTAEDVDELLDDDALHAACTQERADQNT